MKISKNILNKGLKSWVVILGIIMVSGVLALAPGKTEIARSENCNNAPSVATLNFYDVTWNNTSGTGCTDFAPIAIRNTANSTYAPSAAAWPGEELSVSIYVHNGAQQGLDPEKTTARNVAGNVSISGNTIHTSFAGSNTNTKTGDVTVDLPLGGTLEIVPGSAQFYDYLAQPISGVSNLSSASGTFNMGDMRACFEFSKFFHFKVRVVSSGGGGAAAGTITANVGGIFQSTPNCLKTGTVTWTSQNASSILVTVQSPEDTFGQGEHFFADFNTNGSNETPWLQSGHNYLFILYNTSGGQHVELARINETVPAFSCGGGSTATGTIIASVGNIISNSPCLKTGTVTWTSQNASSVSVTVQSPEDTDGQGEHFFADFATSGSNQTPWLQSGHHYIFILYNTAGGGRVELARINETVPAFSCGGGSGPGTLICTVNPSTANVGDTVLMTASGGNAPYTWSTSNNANAFIGNPFSVSFASSGAKTVTVKSGDGQSANCNVTINGGGSGPGTLTCSANPNPANINQNVVFTASGGTAPYTWTTTNNANAIISNPLSVSFATAGIKTATVKSADNQTANCDVNINQATSNPGQLVCSANVSNANVNDTVTFTANGGTDPLTWSTSNNSNAGTGRAINVSFLSTGTKTIGVRDTNGNSTSCTVVINTQQNGGCVDNIFNSCNNNNNTNNQTGGGTNSSNQSNNTNINGNNNTVSNTNNNCVNNSCNLFSNPQPIFQPIFPVIPTPTPIPFPSNPGVMNLSKRAFNETKNQDATIVNATPEDFITYTLTSINNSGVQATNFVVTDDLSQVLPFADLVDSGGGTLSGNTISYPATTVPAGGSISRSFRVRVKFSLPSNLSFVMTNTYGNTVTVRINKPAVLGAFIAPKTGADTLAFSFAGMFTASALAIKKRKYLMKLIFT